MTSIIYLIETIYDTDSDAIISKTKNFFSTFFLHFQNLD